MPRRMVPCAPAGPPDSSASPSAWPAARRTGATASRSATRFNTDRGPDPNKLPPASTLAATRVNTVGSEVVAKNKDDLGVKPVFFTMGVHEVEISHSKSGMVILSEGLVERCPTDTELAAAICHELGKMAAEQAARGRATASRSRRGSHGTWSAARTSRT